MKPEIVDFHLGGGKAKLWMVRYYSENLRINDSVMLTVLSKSEINLNDRRFSRYRADAFEHPIRTNIGDREHSTAIDWINEYTVGGWSVQGYENYCRDMEYSFELASDAGMFAMIWK